MSRFVDTVIIRKSPEVVYDFVTRAGDWPKWHENSEGVEGAIGAPMQLNDVVREKGRIPFKSGWLEWVCTQRDCPTEFKLDGHGMGGKGFVHYKCEVCVEGTRFTRTLDFGFHEGFMKYIEKLITPMVKKAQTKSVLNLKNTIERL